MIRARQCAAWPARLRWQQILRAEHFVSTVVSSCSRPYWQLGEVTGSALNHWITHLKNHLYPFVQCIRIGRPFLKISLNAIKTLQNWTPMMYRFVAVCLEVLHGFWKVEMTRAQTGSAFTAQQPTACTAQAQPSGLALEPLRLEGKTMIYTAADSSWANILHDSILYSFFWGIWPWQSNAIYCLKLS